MNLKLILAIAAGGAVGAVGRHLVMGQAVRLLGTGFPWGTLAVNVAGSFMLGALVEIMALVWSPSQEMRAFLSVGVMGAFTTFSTFSLDVFYLAERGNLHGAGMYILASVTLALMGFFAGLAVFRHILP